LRLITSYRPCGKGEEIMAHSVSQPRAGHGGFGRQANAAETTTAGPAWAFWSEGVRSETMERYGALTGRLLLSVIFLMSGVSKIMSWSAMLGFMQVSFHRFLGWAGLTPTILDAAFPAMLGLAAAVELMGGLSLLLGFKVRLGALLLFLFLIPTTLVFHGFWMYPPEQQQEQMINLMKNLAIMGGLWLAITFGSGLCSLDALRRKQSGQV